MEAESGGVPRIRRHRLGVRKRQEAGVPGHGSGVVVWNSGKVKLYLLHAVITGREG